MNLQNKDIKAFYEHEFDFNHQHKTQYEDWLKAFRNAVLKRAVGGCFIGLSSGYDSGAVACEMLNLGVTFKVYSVMNNEDSIILIHRLGYFPEKSVVEKVDQVTYTRLYNFLDGKINKKAMKDSASPGVAFMFEQATKEGRKVCICPQGGDETISDYSLFPNQSQFKGKFPETLFEWKNFRRGMQEEYLNEIEDIAALYNVECRYPFLDIDLVQEYLWLAVDLKNITYKAPLREYFIRQRFPFCEGVKRGFRPR